MKKIILIILALFAAWFAYHYCFSKKSNFVKNVVFETSDSLNTLIVIQNTGNEWIQFNFSLNNKFYSSLNDFIRKNKKSQEKEQVVLDLFDAQISSLVHEKLFNEWGAIPLVTLNSKGFAICGRQSEIFSQILFNAGFPARIISLNGHLVSEVYYNNAWHLFDTDRKTFFKKDNEILSYKKLVQNPKMFKKAVKIKYIENLTTFFQKYTKLFITEQDNRINKINRINNDTFLLNIPAKSSFVFPYYPDYKKDFFPYNTKAKLFLPKGFDDVVKNPLILIDVEGKGKVKFNKHVYSVPKEIERLKMDIFTSKKFVKGIHVSAFSDSFALVYMLNPIFSKIHTKNNLIINASDSLSVGVIKNNKMSKSTLFPIHLELLNQYTPKAFDLAENITLFNIKNIDELYEKQLKTYCILNNLDTIMVKKRLLLLKELLNEPIENYSEESVFYILAVVLYSRNEEFKNIVLFNYKYQKYKELIRKMKKP
ncbi:MAG: hypothetical protein ACUVQP_12600 [Bacteroidales bacterium]